MAIIPIFCKNTSFLLLWFLVFNAISLNMTKKYDLVILDRDGVINNAEPIYVTSLEDFSLIPGSAKAISLLNQEGIPVALASNQAGVARGLFSHETLEAIFSSMQEQLAREGAHIDFLNYCLDHPDDQKSLRRKPKPGMLLEASAHFNIALDRALFVGDDIRDYKAAQAAKCDFALVKTGHGQHMLAKHQASLEGVLAYNNLLELVKDQLCL